MRPVTHLAISSAFLLVFASGGQAVAQTQNAPWVQMESLSVNLGLGGQSGDGVLHLPNLGTNCTYPFKVQGFGGGIQVGVSKVSASGPVANMTRVADFAGDYGATEGEVTLLAGAGGSTMKNRGNNVVMNLKAETEGIGLGFGAKGMTIKMADTVVNAPRAYVLEFGFNKTWVNEQSRAALDQVARAWKCRYANIWLFGHTDTVGKEDSNLQLSAKRAAAVRDYLIGTGIVPTRVMTEPRGDDVLLVATAKNVRLRTNRAVVVVVQE
jgi:outer membrane protein OmpA-like peptidoglycan-associated protein